MKKLIIAAVILFSCLSFKFAGAQVHFSVGINIGSQPDWGPVGYDHADYYYIPDVGAYYDVNAHQYIYLDNNVWVHETYLPARYRNYDLYSGYKVVVNEREPWRRDDEYRNRYASYRGRRNQPIIRNSSEAKYKEHWRGVAEDRQKHYAKVQGEQQREQQDRNKHQTKVQDQQRVEQQDRNKHYARVQGEQHQARQQEGQKQHQGDHQDHQNN